MVDLSSVPIGFCKVALGISINHSNKSLTTIIPESFYTECIINKCFENSAPTFTNDAYALVCASVDCLFSLDAIDPDNDSFSYSILPCLKAKGLKINYLMPFDVNYPFPILENGQLVQFPKK